jgi:manganese/zinc/iron transport system substrate-binding protein
MKPNIKTTVTLGVLPLCALLLGAMLAGCNSSGAGSHEGHDHAAGEHRFTYSGSGPIKVVTTIGMINDIVKNVGGAHVQTQALMGAGVDPHLYKATPGDLKKLNNADVIFYNGLHLEGKMADILEKMETRKPSIAVVGSLPKGELLKFEAAPEFPDPHVWFDVKKWIFAANVVRDELVEFDAKNADAYKTNADAYIAKLEKLDEYTKVQMAKIPKDRRVLVTAHDAFNYFGKAYDVEVMGLQGISTASEASLRDVQRIVDALVKRKIKAVFVESSVPRRNIEAVVQGARSRGWSVKIGGELFSDAMGKDGTPEGTYDGMMRHNVDTIVGALK